MRQNTPKYELVQLRLGRSLQAYVEAARKERLSWRTIATDLSAVSGVTVSWETLRDWFGDSERPTSARQVAHVPDAEDHSAADPSTGETSAVAS